MNRHNLNDGQSLAPIPQQQAMQTPFQWGKGGRRMTPEQIAREREIATAMMGIDTSPVYSPWQGLARVAENVVGGLRQRKADKAEQSNLDYSDNILQSLMNPGGVPSASGAPGVASPAPGANIAQLSAIVGDPYASPQVKAFAKRQLDMADFETKQKLQSQYAEPTPDERLAQAAFPNDPARQAQFLKAVAANKEDPFVNVIGNETFGTYAGRQSGLNAIINGQGGGATSAPVPGTVVADPRNQGGPPPISSAPPPPNADAMAKARAEADAWMKLNGITR